MTFVSADDYPVISEIRCGGTGGNSVDLRFGVAIGQSAARAVPQSDGPQHPTSPSTAWESIPGVMDRV